MALELTGDGIERQAGQGSEEITLDSVVESQTPAVEGIEIRMAIPTDNSQNANEVGKGDKDNSEFLKDAREVWPTQKQVHSFYFPKYRSFEDPKHKAKIEEAEKDIRKKTNARVQIIEKLKAKRSERALVISELRPLSIKDKEYRSIMGMKRKEMEPLQAALGELRSANIAAREKGMGLCSSEEELDDTIRSLNYRIQHESLTLNEEKQLIKEIKQLEGTREKVIANASTRAKIQDSLGHKEAIRGQVKVITGDIDEVRKDQLSVRSDIKGLEQKLEAIDDAISSLQKELDALAQKKSRAYDVLSELRKSNNEMNASYFKYRSLLNTAKDLAAKKDLASLQELYNNEVENFMSQWSNSSVVREDYEKRILTSLDIRQLSRDGRMRNPDEKPIVVKAPISKEPEAAPAKVAGKLAKENVPSHPQPAVVPVNTLDDQLKKSKVVDSGSKNANAEDISNVPKTRKSVKEPSKSDENDAAELVKPEESEKKSSKLVEIDAEKLKEVVKEEQIAKAKLALERKKKQAEKTAAKAAARAEKEAEKKLKEKEKKAKKKAGETVAPSPAEEADSGVNDAEVDEANESIEVVNVPVVEKSKELKERIKIRSRPRGRDTVPKVMLKKKKANNSYWLWAGPALAAVVALFVLGYYFYLK